MTEIEKLKKENALLKKRAELNMIDAFYIELIKDCAKKEAEKAVAKIMQNPIEMTIEQIEEAFGHKIKIVNSKKDIR